MPSMLRASSTLKEADRATSADRTNKSHDQGMLERMFGREEADERTMGWTVERGRLSYVLCTSPRRTCFTKKGVMIKRGVEDSHEGRFSRSQQREQRRRGWEARADGATSVDAGRSGVLRSGNGRVDSECREALLALRAWVTLGERK